jgi:hypothetical protein
MRSLVAWLHRLAAVTPDPGPEISFFRIAVPGNDPLDVENWLLSIDPQGPLDHGLRATGPESWSIVRVPDLPHRQANLNDRHHLGADIACLLSLALERRVVITNDIGVRIPQLEKITFLPVSQVVDQGILGPLPTDTKRRVNAYLSAVAGLSTEDQEFIGAASSAYHGALLLFDREPRAAYTLLVGGIEVLSRRYGSPPTEWTNWEESSDWDAVFAVQSLTNEQASAVRDRLMHNKQMRLGATFRNYASSRLSDDFWNKPLDQWIYGIDANTGKWLPPTNVKSCRISDILPFDRNGLRQSLGRSYALRSSVVHEADWVELMTLAQPPAQPFNSNRSLPFPILRAILAELIWLEISSHSTPVSLPDFQLLRERANVP